MRSLLTTIFLLFVINSYSQSSFGIKAGASIPVGEFASDDGRDPAAGLAETGLNVEINYQLNVEEKVSILFMYNYQSNPVNMDVVEDVFSSLITAGVPFSVGAKNWKQSRLMVGISLNLPVQETALAVTPRFMLGLNVASNPELVLSYSENGVSTEIRTFDKPTESLVLLAGLGLKYKVSESVSLITHLDYTTSTIEFEDVVTERMDNNFLTFNSRDSFEVRIKTLAASLGISIRI